MKAVIARATLVGLFALGGSGAAWANQDCGMNSNKPCPGQGKTSSKEPAYKSLNSNKATSQRAGDSPPARTNVQASASGETATKATLSGISASDLKKPPQGACSMNSNTPCADQGQSSAPTHAQASESEESAAKATLTGVNPSDLKIKPKPTSTFEKEPATKP